MTYTEAGPTVTCQDEHKLHLHVIPHQWRIQSEPEVSGGRIQNMMETEYRSDLMNEGAGTLDHHLVIIGRWWQQSCGRKSVPCPRHNLIAILGSP
jgi:hypothetical protein